MKTVRDRSRLFLLELVISVSLFALCAAVCTAMLLNARSMARESAALNDAVYLAQSAAETLRSGGIPAPRSGEYDVCAAVTEEEAGLCSAKITVARGGETVYTLDAAWPEGVAGP